MQVNKWAAPGASITPQVRSLRKVNNDQVAIAIDVDPGSGGKLEDEDDDKGNVLFPDTCLYEAYFYVTVGSHVLGMSDLAIEPRR